MVLILSEIHTLDQHIQTFLDHPDDYRPCQCPHCGNSNLWAHGVYYRQACCESPTGCPAPIPRFLCSLCKHTCSTLPEYIPPRRWYHWLVQHLALQLTLIGKSLMQVWQALYDQVDIVPSLCTLQRWLSRWHQRFVHHRFHLLNAHPALGYHSNFHTFWQAWLEHKPLSTAMLIVNRHLTPIP